MYGAILGDIIGSPYEFDRGERQLLNFGHTLAHSVELLSEYNITHGNAVAMGMVSISKACAKKNICSEECSEKICNMVQKHGLPVEIPYLPKELAEASYRDKKRNGKNITIVVPEIIGRCSLKTISADDIIEYIGE